MIRWKSLCRAGTASIVVPAMAALVMLANACAAGPTPTPTHSSSSSTPSSAASGELQVVSNLNIAAAPENITDIWALAAASGKSYAYLGSFDQPSCRSDITGVHIVDISDPAQPAKAGFLPAPPGTRVNDVKVEHISTPLFQGDILVHSTELCVASPDARAAASPGIVLYDVTDPLSPRRLAPGFSLNSQVHNLYVYQQGERAYVAVVEDEAERDFHIVDITDPNAPVEVAVRGRPDWFGPGDQLALGAAPGPFLHDVWVRSYPATLPNASYAGKTIAYLAYWDAGLVILDVTDPANPIFLGDSDYQDPDPVSGLPPEGNSHAAVPTEDGSLVFMSDEDFATARVIFSVDTGDWAGQYPAAEARFTRPLSELDGGLLSGVAVFVGQACTVAGIPPPTAGAGAKHIALIERGVCEFEQKVSNAAAAGYDGAIVFSGVDSPGEIIPMSGDPAKGPIPALFVPRSVAFAILGMSPESAATTPLPAPGTSGQRVSARHVFDGWGYGRILDVADPANIVELGQFATENVMKQPSPPGDHSMHNVVVRDRQAYISWYADGIRVVDFSNPESPREVARFVDEVRGSDFWGVYLFEHPDGQTYILGSDRSTGLWVFAAP